MAHRLIAWRPPSQAGGRHAAVEAALVEARRRARLNEEWDKPQGPSRGGPLEGPRVL